MIVRGKEIKMEVVREVKMKLHIETDRRKVEKDFDNLYDLKIFMDNFFTEFANRRSAKSTLRYVGPERRMRVG